MCESVLYDAKPMKSERLGGKKDGGGGMVRMREEVREKEGW